MILSLLVYINELVFSCPTLFNFLFLWVRSSLVANILIYAFIPSTPNATVNTLVYFSCNSQTAWTRRLSSCNDKSYHPHGSSYPFPFQGDGTILIGYLGRPFRGSHPSNLVDQVKWTYPNLTAVKASGKGIITWRLTYSAWLKDSTLESMNVVLSTTDSSDTPGAEIIVVTPLNSPLHRPFCLCTSTPTRILFSSAFIRSAGTCLFSDLIHYSESLSVLGSTHCCPPYKYTRSVRTHQINNTPYSSIVVPI